LIGRVSTGALRHTRCRCHHDRVEDTEATQLMLETLFDIRAAVYEIHDVVVAEDEGDEEEEEEDT
jgi:hypothetical protein